MREYISMRLAEMKNPEERALLKEILNSFFLPLYDETEAKYAALERRVRDELPHLYAPYTVYSTVLLRSQVDGKHAYLGAMIPLETEEPVLNTTELMNALPDGQAIIETVFMEADYMKCRQIVRDQHHLKGEFVINAEKYPFSCQLVPATRYFEQIETLYRAFFRNNVPWTTINSSYLYKFFDLKLIETADMPENKQIHQAEISFAPYENFVRRGFIPVWNIDTYSVKGEAFPEPAEDNINLEYRFEIDKLGLDNAFLIDYESGLVLSARREHNQLVIVTTQQYESDWDLYRLRRRQDTWIDHYPYPVLSNQRRDTFAARLNLEYEMHAATPASMRMLIHSLEPSDYLELNNYHFTSEKIPSETYDMNLFIRDEIRDPSYKKTLILVFKAKQHGLFLNYDLASFLVSEFQTTYPEYRCVGTVI